MKEQKPTHPLRRYRLQLISERKDRPVFSFSMPIWVTALLALFTTALTVLLVIVVMTRTPLRQYLPGYLDVSKRAEVMESAMRLDSLERENELRTLYMAQMVEVLKGRSLSDSLPSYDSAVVRLQDTLMAKSEREQNFVQRYVQRERFGIDALDVKVQPQSMTWIVPVKAEVIVPEDSLQARDVTVTNLRLSHEMSVLSPLEGTIINQQYIVGQGWELTLMAANDYVVVFSRLTLVLGDVGRQVRAGAAIAHAGGQSSPQERWMSLRIWHKGKPVDAAEVMGWGQ